jgi:hypothetical protein
MTHFAISGRICGDDEDQTHLIDAETLTDARQAFIDDMREAEDDPEAEVFITSVVASRTEIFIDEPPTGA